MYISDIIVTRSMFITRWLSKKKVSVNFLPFACNKRIYLLVLNIINYTNAWPWWSLYCSNNKHKISLFIYNKFSRFSLFFLYSSKINWTFYGPSVSWLTQKLFCDTEKEFIKPVIKHNDLFRIHMLAWLCTISSDFYFKLFYRKTHKQMNFELQNENVCIDTWMIFYSLQTACIFCLPIRLETIFRSYIQ